jgi:hypothetical protein
MHFTLKTHRLIIAMLAMLFLVAAASLGQAGKSGIIGVVVQMGRPGPTRPNHGAPYYSGPLEVMRFSDGQLAGRTTSDEHGKFTITLPPGKYFITQSKPYLSRIHSDPITVEKGKFTSVKIIADNRMR